MSEATSPSSPEAGDRPGALPAGATGQTSHAPTGISSIALSDTSALRVQRIGPYEVRRKLGQGGVATVYLADQSEPVQRRVALKVIQVAGVTDEQLQRFQAEMRTLAFLNHDNIAKVFDAGSTGDGLVYCALEYVQGAPVTEFCDRHEFNLQKRLELFLQICNAVQYMHSKGIIHRDLKPSNVLITEAGGAVVVKVIDFGIAKITEDSANFRGDVTEQGAILGTPIYMSPEQASGAAGGVDVRTDVFSLGMLMYELVVGALPYDHPDPQDDMRAFLARVAREDPPRPSTRFLNLGSRRDRAARLRGVTPSALLKLIASDLDWIVSRAVAHDREERYPTVNAFAEDVEAYLSDDPIRARPPTVGYRLRQMARRHRGAALMLASIGFALLAGLTLSSWSYLGAVESEGQRLAILRSVNEVETTLANAHLWFEEGVAGDRTIVIERDVFAPIGDASANLRTSANDGGPHSLALTELAGEIDRLGDSARRRWETRGAGGESGSVSDQEFDSIYLSIAARCARLEETLSAGTTEAWSRFARASIAVNICAALLLGAGISFWLLAGGSAARSRKRIPPTGK